MVQTVHPGSVYRILIFYPSRIPCSGVKRAPDPGSGTLLLSLPIFRSRIRNNAFQLAGLKESDPELFAQPDPADQGSHIPDPQHHLDLFAEHAVAVHFAHRRLGVLFAIEGDEGETLSRVVHIRHRPESLEFTLV
jgi:hypothetical protein